MMSELMRASAVSAIKLHSIKTPQVFNDFEYALYDKRRANKGAVHLKQIGPQLGSLGSTLQQVHGHVDHAHGHVYHVHGHVYHVHACKTQEFVCILTYLSVNCGFCERTDNSLCPLHAVFPGGCLVSLLVLSL